jgi:anti-anti-sigma regulatory factor
VSAFSQPARIQTEEPEVNPAIRPAEFRAERGALVAARRRKASPADCRCLLACNRGYEQSRLQMAPDGSRSALMPQSFPSLELQCSRVDRSAVITCRGSLVSKNCQRLEQAIDQARAAGVERLRLDLTGLTVIDAAAADCIGRAILRCESTGVGLTIATRPPAPSSPSGTQIPEVDEGRGARLRLISNRRRA